MNAAAREHPGELDLTRLHIGELSPEEARRLRAHLETCAACQEQLAKARRVYERFPREIPYERFAAGVERAVRAADARRPRRRRLLPAATVLAAAAAGLLLVLNLGRIAPTHRVKGGAEVDLYVGGDGHTRTAATREMLAPGERIRIQYKPGEWSYLTVVSIDESGEVSPLYPVSGTALPIGRDGPGAHLLPDSIEFTGSGLERIIVVMTDRPLTVEEVAEAAREAYEAAGGDVDSLPDLDLPGEQFHRLIIKP
ncbi:MAG: DUF4384 domain-containing protein [Deltaproteobacteria bacterium]|nr:MAG: DUF4384 domain-containing protein [Deltaproteobacteria bacterium]